MLRTDIVDSDSTKCLIKIACFHASVLELAAPEGWRRHCSLTEKQIGGLPFSTKDLLAYSCQKAHDIIQIGHQNRKLPLGKPRTPPNPFSHLPLSPSPTPFVHARRQKRREKKTESRKETQSDKCCLGSRRVFSIG
jgi:hypothetical protein